MEKVLLVEKDQSNKDLSNKDLTRQNLIGFNFTNTNLTGASLFKANLTDVDFSGANLTKANLTIAILKNTNLTNANLINATLKLANLTNANLTNANLTNANLTMAILTEADLTNANLINANLMMANLTNVNLTQTNLTDADLTSANLRSANLTRTNLRNVNLTDANIANADFTNALNYAPMRRVNPYEIHQEMVKVLNNLPIIFQLMNPNNETIPTLNTSLLINEKLDSLVNNLQPTTNYDEAFLTNLKQNMEQLKQKINGFGSFTNATFQDSYREYTRDIQNGSMQMHTLISYPLFFIEKLTPDTICYYLDDWSNGSLTAYDNAVSCAKGICERFVMSVAAALQIYFDENTQNDPVLKTNYGEIISLILNKEYNSSIHYLDASQFKTMVLDKCFQEWYGEHTFDEIATENVDAELQKFKDCVKLKYDALPDKLNPSSDNYEEMVENYIETILKITKGGNKKKTLKKRNKRKTNKKKTLKKRNKRKTNKKTLYKNK
jgi:uncharacterized protein YjbI with pentapeptide repeats